MARFLSWFLVPTIVLAGLVGGQTALAQKKTDPAHSVQDDAGLFSQAAKDRANQTIQQIKTQFKKDFMVETQATAPEDAKDAAAFAKWAQGRAKNLNINGVYVIVTKKPGKLQVVVGSKTRELGYFTDKDRDGLRDLMIAKLEDKKPDEALADGATFVLETIRRHKATAAAPAQEKRQPAQGASPAPANAVGEINWGKWILIGLAVLLGVWIISALIRAMSGGGSGAPGMGGGGYGGGGGGFFSSLLGGLFGAAAGMWLYSNLFGGHTPSAHGGDYGSAGSSGAEPTDVGGDYSSSGGEYGGGDDAGGGDWGGGGGDWGGGGGDFGGGGGDFGGGGD